MTPERFAEIKRLFAAVADLPAAERAAGLRRLTAGEEDGEELSAEVLALHAAGTGTTRLSSTIAAAAAALASAAIRPPAAGDVLGVWRLAGEIGQGGMGSVFLAERDDGHFQQRGAVKFLRGLPHPEALALFTRERQLLATLTHPNIARLLDGGATPQGQPYLVMEHVEGSHIDQHCRRHGLGVRAVLRLFLAACDAVAAAHRQMVIHCDLKPSNLLVDGHGRPVLLDFGIARLVEQVAAEGAAAGAGEEHGASPGFTPRYASPEQRAQGRVSTASDVYSLGVLLGELLAAAADHGRQPALCRRELAAIVERARRADPAERYPTVDALTADIRSFLDQRPVQALAGRAGYGLRKGLARHRAWVAAAAASLLLATGFTFQVVAESRRARQAEQAARTAEQAARTAEQAARTAEASSRQVSEFLVSIFEASNPEEEIVDIPTSRLIEQAEARLEAELRGQPATRSDLYGALAKVQANLGRHDRALAHYRRALDIERGQELGQRRPLARARLLDGLVRLSLEGFSASSAEGDAREALALWERHAGPAAPETAAARELLAGTLDGARKFAQAERLYLENVRRGERAGPSPELAATWQGLGLCYTRWGRHDRAVAALRRSLALWESQVGETDERTLTALQSLGLALASAGRFEEAERMLRRNLAGERRRVGADAPSVAWALSELARVLLKAGRGRDAVHALDEALAIAARRRGAESVDYGIMLVNRAVAADLAGDVAAAERDYTRALALLGKSGAGEMDLAVLRHGLGRLLTRLGKLDAAAVQLRASLAARIATLGETSEDVGLARFALAEWNLRAGQVDRAWTELARARALVPAPSPERRVNFVRLEALIRARRGQTAAALRGLAQAERLESGHWGARDPRALLGRLHRAELLAGGTPEQQAAGAALAAEILAGVRPSLVPDVPVLARLEQLARKP